MPDAFLSRSGNRFFGAPSAFNSRSDSAGVYSGYISPFSRSSSLRLDGDESVGSGVSSLLFRRSPIAVTWLIISVVITAFYGVVGSGLFPHVGKEVHKLAPSLADLYPTTPIASVSRISWASASGKHHPPRSMLGCAGEFVGNGALSSDTSTAYGVPVSQSLSGVDDALAAIAEAYPHDATFVISCGVNSDCYKPSKPFVSDVNNRMIHSAHDMTELPPEESTKREALWM